MSPKVTTDLLLIRRSPADTCLRPTIFMGAVLKSQSRLAAVHWELAGSIPSVKDRGSIKERIPFKTKCSPRQGI